MTGSQIISNLEDSNHLYHVTKVFNNSDKIIIVSPFLSSNLNELLSRFDFSTLNEIDLITTFKPQTEEQITKPFILKDYFEYFSQYYPKAKTKLHIDNELHGKIFFGTKNGKKTLVLGSANFTNNGLQKNHEWSFLIREQSSIDSLIEEVFGCIEYLDVTYTQIKKACQFADVYNRNNPDWMKQTDIHSDILEDVYTVEDKDNDNPQYFLKPMGVTENPILLEDHRPFNDLHENLHFSKKRPKGVKKGDIVITVAVTAGALISHYKVTGSLNQVTEQEIQAAPWKERWPWYIEARNLSTEFGEKWWEYNLQKKALLEEFLDRYPESHVTVAGGRTLGTLNFGSDKVLITKEFGDFLISKIEALLK